MMKNKKVVLITGGSSGVGFEKAKLFTKEGYKVVICGRSKERLDKCKGLLKDLDVFPCDITNSSERHELVSYMTKKYGRLDILINNAGIGNRY